MSDYTPGSAYDLGYNARMKGSSKPNNVLVAENNVYWQEWEAGWEDAHQKIINESRNRNMSCKSPKCCKNKKFIQD
jgi:hypothetical protein